VRLLFCALALLTSALPGRAQMVTGAAMPGFAETFGLAGNPTYQVQIISSGAGGRRGMSGRRTSFGSPGRPGAYRWQ